MSLRNDFFKEALETIPGHGYMKEMFYFIIKPDIRDGYLESTPLNKAGKNFISSLLFLGILTSTIDWLIRAENGFSLGKIINPIYLMLALLSNTLIYGLIYSLIISIFNYFIKIGLIKLYFMQVVQAFSVINIPIMILYFIAIDLITTAGGPPEPNLFTALVCLLTSIFLFVRLLWLPTYRYSSQYCSKKTSFAILFTSVAITFFLSGYLTLGIGVKTINKKEFCEYYYQKQNQNNNNESQEKFFTEKCVVEFKKLIS